MQSLNAMKAIGFIGNEHDLQHRLAQLKKLYKKTAVSILNVDIDAENPNELVTVEELVEQTDLIFFGHNATGNLPLLYHTIKKANRVFIDIKTPFSKSVFLKCKAYQEEAGSFVTFNINPFLILNDLLESKSEDNNQVMLRFVSESIDLKDEIYKYLLFGHLYLNCSNMRSHFNIIKDENDSFKLINSTLSNLKGRQVNIIVGNYSQKINQLQVFDQKQITELSIPNKKFFNDSQILKRQLDALYNDQPLAELSQGAAVAELFNKMNDRTKH
jgi:hypothetical protein